MNIIKLLDIFQNEVYDNELLNTKAYIPLRGNNIACVMKTNRIVPSALHRHTIFFIRTLYAERLSKYYKKPVFIQTSPIERNVFQTSQAKVAELDRQFLTLSYGFSTKDRVEKHFLTCSNNRFYLSLTNAPTVHFSSQDGKISKIL